MNRRLLFVAAVLLLVTVVVFLPVTQNGFVGFDDDEYILENPHVLAGLSWDGVAWAVRSAGYTGNWHPLTWISLMTDVTLFGTDPRRHHAISLALHAASAGALLWALYGMTAALWRSALVAALFALHPLHVESVAWAAERKDVLSGFFWMLALLAYFRYARSPGAGRYVLVVAALTLGLASKPMLVTLPLVFLLLDYWPLQRFRHRRRGGAPVPGALWRLVVEKVPLLLICAASALVTTVAQYRGDALGTLEKFPFPTRLTNAVVSYALYLVKTFWPTNLAFYYPYPREVPTWQWVLAGLLLAVVTAAAVRARRTQPHLLTGWLLYLTTLAPVIGVIQVGEQARADRYTYLPLTGIFVIAAWGLAKLPLRRAVAGAASIAVLLALAAGARAQVLVWRDEITLFTHAARVTTGNWVAEFNLGVTLSEAGKYSEAAGHYEAALRDKPDYAEAHNNLGIALGVNGRPEEALRHYAEALKYKPDYVSALCNMAATSESIGRHEEAVALYRRGLALDPADARIHLGLAAALSSTGREGEARRHVLEAQRLGNTLR